MSDSGKKKKSVLGVSTFNFIADLVSRASGGKEMASEPSSDAEMPKSGEQKNESLIVDQSLLSSQFHCELHLETELKIADSIDDNVKNSDIR